ncbi:sporulation integral membrane protein YtvI [Lederbergia wuyishanensis]|uniref:Sporulation integral membrane protein YtvI n=1 Tax=Lederbergia wuyishanensis TaxID=1347903 RepID=A0ABU0CZD8_9BACI|nr:sporulation integral membrane protein YtvI [Lederbergia wuyishanensis]MCJ8006145.1 sporulation integral membrane protein YtvI [Lederbergia wuyishanensis]MDQ0341514.1 sporulation integral membrane protein YtvI [Lederbergia wuyishanensis]
MSGLSKKVIFIAIFLLILIALFFYYILPISIPLIIALITALMLEPAVKFVQSKLRLKRQLSIVIVFTIFTLLLAFAIFFIITKAISQGIKLVEDAPGYIHELSIMWKHYEEYFSNAAQDFPDEIVTAITDEVNNFLESFMLSLKQYVKIENISALLSYIPNYLVSFLVYLIALFMFMIDLPRLRASIYNYMTEKTSEKVKFMSSRLSSVIFGFFKAQFLVSLIIMLAAFIGLIIIAPKVAIIMTLVIWIIDLIPIIGSIVILAPWSLYHFFTGNIALGTKLAILAVILLIIRRTVEPKVMGQHMGLSPLATLISMFLGLKLLGVLGLIIGPTLLIVFKSAKEAGLIKLNFKI